MSTKQKTTPHVKRSFGSRVRRAMLRLLLRSWAGVLILVLLLIGVLTVYQMWLGGLVMIVSLLPQLVIILILIAAVLAVRHLVHLWQTGAIKRAFLESLGEGQTVIKGKVQQAKGVLSSLGDEMKENLGVLVGGDSVHSHAAVSGAAHCPSCGRPIKAGAQFCDACGAALPSTCAKCGRPLRPQAKFCDGCGAAISSGR
jgi:predicted nucleic acid-binding Zn ribbon protein